MEQSVDPLKIIDWPVKAKKPYLILIKLTILNNYRFIEVAIIQRVHSVKNTTIV
jgi:hypothetical protein